MARTPEDKIWLYNSGLGSRLERRWGLQHDSRLAQWFNERGVFHAQTMSASIIRSFWRHLNSREIRLEEQIGGLQVSASELAVYSDFFRFLPYEPSLEEDDNFLPAQHSPGSVQGEMLVLSPATGTQRWEAKDLATWERDTSAFLMNMFGGAGIRKETVTDFIHKNRMPAAMSTAIDGDFEVALLLPAIRRELSAGASDDADAYWDRFYDRFPKAMALMSFSRVGFDAKRTQAVLYADWASGPRAGRGFFHFLVRVKGRWVIKSSFNTWIS